MAQTESNARWANKTEAKLDLLIADPDDLQLAPTLWSDHDFRSADRTATLGKIKPVFLHRW